MRKKAFYLVSTLKTGFRKLFQFKGDTFQFRSGTSQYGDNTSHFKDDTFQFGGDTSRDRPGITNFSVTVATGYS